MKPREEVEALKQNWLKDGYWDLEETEGFEEYKEELKAFRLETERKREEDARHLKERAIFGMKLHDELWLQSDIHVLRVVGGWIYSFYPHSVCFNSNNNNVSSVFVGERQSEKEKERMVEALKRLERVRKEKRDSKELPDYIIRVCQAEIAEMVGYCTREEWTREINALLE